MFTREWPSRGRCVRNEHVVGAYFVVSRAHSVEDVGETIAYLMTTTEHDPPKGSLLAQCTGQVLGFRSLRPLRADRPCLGRFSRPDDAV